MNDAGCELEDILGLERSSLLLIQKSPPKKFFLPIVAPVSTLERNDPQSPPLGNLHPTPPLQNLGLFSHIRSC